MHLKQSLQVAASHRLWRRKLYLFDDFALELSRSSDLGSGEMQDEKKWAQTRGKLWCHAPPWHMRDTTVQISDPGIDTNISEPERAMEGKLHVVQCSEKNVVRGNRVALGGAMESMETAVIGMYRRQDDLEEAVGALIIKGFPSDTISALIPEQFSEKERKAGPVALENGIDSVARHEIARGTVGLLDDLGLISLPDLGPVIGAGPLMRALANGDSSGPGAVAAILEDMGAASSEAKRYEQTLKRRALVSVRCHDSEWVARARQVLERTGAERLSLTSGREEKPKVRHGGVAPL